MKDSAKKIKYLVISALGEDHTGIVKNLSEAVHDEGCNIVDSRMSVLGGHFAIITLVSGQWNELARLEAQLPELEKKLGMTIISRHTELKAPQISVIPYSVEVVSIDHPGIVYNLTSFFYARDINIENVNTTTYSAPHSGAPMFALEMTVNMPDYIPIGQLRDDFLDYCDELNLDAHIEPCKMM